MIYAVLLILLPALLCCGIVFVWSIHSASRRLSRILRWSAIIWAILATATFTAGAYAHSQCNGDWLYGPYDCQVLSDELSHALMASAILTFLAGSVFGLFLLVFGGLTEVLARRKTT